MKVVIDTNVLLSGVATHGICEEILDICVDCPDIKIVLSEYILTEFFREYQDKFGMSAEKARMVVEFLRNNSELVEPIDVHADACLDPNDLPILGTLLAAKANCLVTGDKDLLDLKKFQSIPILTPRAFYQKLR